MKKTTYFRIELFPAANSVCETIALMAAKSNGAEEKADINTLYQAAKFMLTGKSSATMFENSFNMDIHIEGEGTRLGAIITEVEIMEMDDIPQELFTAANGYGGLAE